ncbi:leucine-rich repeat-containing protein kinase family protein [Chitinibacteraceae bacterium HSL-7]
MHTLSDLQQGRLDGATRIDLSAGLAELPESLRRLADTLEVLNVSGNALSTLPDWLADFPRLRIVFASDNAFTELPTVLGRCPALEMIGFKANRITRVPAEALPARLRWLTLTDNAIEVLPDALGQCLRLEKLMLAGNRLSALPDLSACHRLALIRLAANRMHALPDWLFTLPALAWLALAGNPCCPDFLLDTKAVLDPPICGDLLGDGASGHIYASSWRGQDVAIKVFKGAMTSDGLPDCELAAALHAGPHAHLIGTLGHFNTGGTPALILPRVPAHYRVLAAPPSLSTCSRDVYDPSATFTPVEARALAQGITAAIDHLHAKALTHGDLYAHNVLHDGLGHGWLGDFGAATPCPPEYAARMQAIEIRALGHLLDELSQRTPGSPMAALAQRCLQPSPAARPTAKQVRHELATLDTL